MVFGDVWRKISTREGRLVSKICGTRFLFARFIVPPQPVVYVFPTTTEHLNAVEYLVPTKSVPQTKRECKGLKVMTSIVAWQQNWIHLAFWIHSRQADLMLFPILFEAERSDILRRGHLKNCGSNFRYLVYS